MGAMGDYKFLSCGEVPIGAAFAASGETDLPAWLHYFRVADIEQAANAIQSSGGLVVHGPHEVPGGEHVVIARDPQGAAFGLVAA
jgi:predicted enzyme related to lactoylglutathione lyase